MIPILYSADEKDFSTQGLGLLSDIQKADVTEQRNAEYYLEFSVPVFSKMFKEIKLERLVKVDDHNSEDQLFRIKKIDTPSKGLCDVYAEHISRDIEGYTIKPEVHIAGPAQQALEIWRKNLVEKDKVKVFSDITTDTPTKRWFIDEMENPFFCLGGKEGSILQLYKGEYQFDNLTVKLLKSRGFNTGASITYGRNMSDMKQDESIEELANSIYPFAWKEQESGESEKEREMIVLDPLYIDGPHIDKYAERRVMFVDFSDKKPKDKAALKKIAERYVKDNNVGAPKVGMDVSPILNGQIAKGLELEKFERVNLCDIVTVKYYQLGIDVQAKVNEVTYDVLAQKFSNYRLGDERRTLASSLGKIENSVNNVGKELGKVTGWAQQSADGKNTIFYGKNEPTANKVGDTWFKENPDGSATIHVWDGQTWKEVKTDYTEEFEKLDKELEEQKSNIDNALDKAEQAIKDAGFAQDGVNQVVEDVTQQANKIDELDQTVISNGHSIEELDGSIKETIAKTDINSKNIVQIEKNHDGLSTIVSELEKDFDNLGLPARNIVCDSLVEECSTSCLFKTFDTTENWSKEDSYQFVLQGELPPNKSPRFYGEDTYGAYLAELTKISENLYGYNGKIRDVKSLKNKLKIYLYPDDKQEYCIDWVAVYKNDDTTKWYPALEDNSKTLAKHWTAIEQNSKDIKTTATTVDKQGTKISQIEQDSKGIKTSVTELQNQDLGIRNYFINSGSLNNDNIIPIGSAKISTITQNVDVPEWNTSNATTVQVLDAVPNNICCSLIGRLDPYNETHYGEKSVTSIYIINNGTIPIVLSDNAGGDFIVEPKKPMRVVIKNKKATAGLGYRINIRSKATATNFTIWHPKIEEGDRVTDWIPAPEDSEIKFSTIEQTVNGIQTTVEDKADKSQVTQLSGQITSVVKNNSVPNLITNSSMINRDYTGWELEQGWYISTITRDGNGYLAINSTTDTLSRANNEYLEIRANSKLSFSIESFVERINGGKWYVAIAFYDDNKKYISEEKLELTDTPIKTYKTFNLDGSTVPKYSRYTRVSVIAKGDVYGYFGKPMLSQSDIAIPYRPSEVSQSQITQTKEMINLKVSKGDVVGQINVEAGQTLIQNNKVVIDAKTTVIKGTSWMDGAIIKDATIGTAQIKNASITNAKIRSLDAGKLTAGTISTGDIKIASTLEMTGENGTLNGHYDFYEPVGETIRPRRFVGSWQLGRRLMRFVGETFDSETGRKSYTNTYFGQDQVKFRKYRNGDPEDITARIDMSVYDEANIAVVDEYKELPGVKQKASIMGKGMQGRVIGAKSITTREYMLEGKQDLSKYLFIYPTNPMNPTVDGGQAFRIRYYGDDGVTKVNQIGSTFIYNATGGGAYDVKISSNGNLKSSRGAHSASALNVSKPIAVRRMARSVGSPNILPNVDGIDNLTPSMWIDEHRPKEAKKSSRSKRSLDAPRPMNNMFMTGYTIEDLVEAGLTNAVIYNKETGEPDGINLHGLMPYIFENMKMLKMDNEILRNRICQLEEDITTIKSGSDHSSDNYEDEEDYDPELGM